MEVLYFLKQRTNFLKRHYDTASAPFIELKRKIEAGDEPYKPLYSEDPEPPFLEEWLDADTSLYLLGAACISVLSDSLRLYFMAWERELRVSCHSRLKRTFKRHGFIRGYKLCFGHLIGTDWSDCPVDFAVLEQIVLARNTVQHPEDITNFTVWHSDKDKTKHPRPFFISEIEQRMIDNRAVAEPLSLLIPTVTVTRESLFDAIRQVEMLGEWMEERLFTLKYPGNRGSEGRN